MTTRKSRPVKTRDYRRHPFMNLSLDDMEGEEWEDIPSFDGFYWVSNYGRIWALPRPVRSTTGQFYYTRERIRKQFLELYYNSFTKDYTEQLSVHLRYEGREFTYKVNRLVYDLFVHPINARNEHLSVVHQDGDNCNNRWDNLVMMDGTRLYAHGLSLNRRPRTSRLKKRNKLIWSEFNSPRSVIQYSLQGKKTREFTSVADAAMATGSHRGSIRAVAMKRIKQLNGFVYRFKGDRYRGEHSDFSWEKKVTQYTAEGKKLAVYPSVKNASLKTGIDRDTISKSALKKFRFAGGYVWRYAGETYKGEYEIKNKARVVIQYSLAGKKIGQFKSINEAALKSGHTASTLLDCAHKRTKVSHGYVWRFEGEPYRGEYKDYRIGRPVTQFSREGETINTFATIEEAARKTGLTPDNIQKNVKGENKTAGGFVWRHAITMEIERLPDSLLSRSVRPALKGKEIIQYSVEGKKLRVFNSITEAAKVCGISGTNLSFVLDKPNRSAAGFVWRTQGNRYYGELAKNPASNAAKVVTQYDFHGKRVNVFKSASEAGKRLGIASTTISGVANGKLKSTGGFIWQYGQGPAKINVSDHYASTLEFRNRVSKPVVKFSLDGIRLQEYPSISAAARTEKVSVNRISSAVNGYTNSAIGFLWKLKS